MTQDMSIYTQGKKSQVAEPALERRREPLGSTVKTTLRLYLDTLDGHAPGPIYEMVIAEVERPMFEAVMDYVNGNQSRAALILNISRSTLRKKLKDYNLD
jgi:Fis family transcriptional regulator